MSIVGSVQISRRADASLLRNVPPACDPGIFFDTRECDTKTAVKSPQTTRAMSYLKLMKKQPSTRRTPPLRCSTPQQVNPEKWLQEIISRSDPKISLKLCSVGYWPSARGTNV